KRLFAAAAIRRAERSRFAKGGRELLGGNAKPPPPAFGGFPSPASQGRRTEADRRGARLPRGRRRGPIREGFAGAETSSKEKSTWSTQSRRFTPRTAPRPEAATATPAPTTES